MDHLNKTRVALRLGVCNDCSSRTPLENDRSPSGPRACEMGCDIFHYLPRLASVIRRFGGEPPCGYELAVLSLPCRKCGEPARHGRNCEFCDGRRPLERYVERALATIETMEGIAVGRPGPILCRRSGEAG
jgi:hypothetical protein